MKEIICYIGLDVHKESIVVAIAREGWEPICSPALARLCRKVRDR